MGVGVDLKLKSNNPNLTGGEQKCICALGSMKPMGPMGACLRGGSAPPTPPTTGELRPPDPRRAFRAPGPPGRPRVPSLRGPGAHGALRALGPQGP